MAGGAAPSCPKLRAARVGVKLAVELQSDLGDGNQDRLALVSSAGHPAGHVGHGDHLAIGVANTSSSVPS